MTQKNQQKFSDIDLKIKDLSFRFAGRMQLLKNVSLEVKTGETVALLGEIGSGKSTIIQILQKFYDYESGEILVNNQNFRELPIPFWRENIGVVSQHTKLFGGTVGENICLENYAEKRAEVLNFCKENDFNLFFNTLPQGIDTLVGEDGINLSGGQRQLIAFARALFRQPALLLLDEPTSAMDTKTEKFVIELLQQKTAHFATIIVTHRHSLANFADRIYRLENGTTGKYII